MPSISFNKTTWDGKYDWANRGDEWSAAWGGPFMQWHGSLLPRIKAHLPAKRILEIAPGYGRWTEYLKDLCEHLTAVDLSEECINACKQRFSACRNITYVLNDGASLQMIDDESVDFAFSFDSLVHADISVIESYLSQMHRILSPGGVLLHPSLEPRRISRPVRSHSLDSQAGISPSHFRTAFRPPAVARPWR